MKTLIGIFIAVIIFTSCNNFKTTENNQDIQKEDSNELIASSDEKELDENNIDEPVETEQVSKYEDENWAINFLKESIVSVDSLVEEFDECCISECGEWNYPREDELKNVISKMVWEHSMDVTEIYNTKKCEIVGRITTSSNKVYDFYMNAGGYIEFYFEDQQFYLGCRDSTLSKYFLSIRPTPEEFEEMMTEE